MYWSNDRECPETASTGSSTPPTPSADRFYAPISGNAWPSLQSQTTKDVLQSVLKVRKSWKTLRGGETVWPLDLEAALLEGKPMGSFSVQHRRRGCSGAFQEKSLHLGLYFREDRKRRSAKQVGSRLQQLRESCGGKKLLHLLSPFRQPAYSGSSASSDSSCTSPVSPFQEGQASASAPCARHTIMYIDILPVGTPEAVGKTSPPMWLETGDVVHASERPRHLASINPTVTFMSLVPVAAQSRSTVYSEDRVPVHADTTPLTPVVDAPVPGFLYSTTLVPEYWKVISESPDPTQFTIYQEVVKDDNSAIVFSATYKFIYPSRDSFSFPSPLDTLNAPNTRPDMDALISPISLEHPQFAADRYPVYVAPDWSPTLHSRQNSPTQGYHSPSSDSSTCFPSDLSNYVSVGNFAPLPPL
ncbi:hypothetical protein B0H13DRAFT_2338885 [Mycena leptocephala]|nr:hypothetical protein B0H13DRAFT_2338885 [Mycena leptocephala]